MVETMSTHTLFELLQAVLNENAKVLSAFLEFEVNGIRLRIDIDEERAPQAAQEKPPVALSHVDPSEVQQATRPNFSSVPRSALAALFNQVADADPAPRHIAQEHLPAAATNPECAPASDEEIAAMARASRASGTGSPPMTVPRR